MHDVSILSDNLNFALKDDMNPLTGGPLMKQYGMPRKRHFYLLISIVGHGARLFG
ncbi:hypothetical protein GCM10017044_24500 [Kordiimonas sediminis]|uniref:Uncharacterized protein n=1 Tax=Kordiimonas sediminis TaxID=1735581 RepID=A0A919AWJ9_9PROT|nr:hypothetical protein GCM10017044_24500 [Kordiimonas sediminis]